MMSDKYLKITDDICDCPQTLENARQKDGAFTRKRSMSLVRP